MRRIYKGDMHNLIIKKLDINAGNVKILEYEKPIVRKDLQFYRGRMGNYISFEHNTRLPDEIEALEYLVDVMSRRENKEAPYPTCAFVNESEIELSHEISDSSFKALRKYYKQLRKEEQKKRSR